MSPDQPPGERVVGGRYALGTELGRGGMGVVWLATDQVLQREVALKEISYPIHLTDTERAVLRERTLREARAAARLDHPCVVTIHDVVEEDGRPWLVMEHVHSRSLQRLIEETGPLSPVEVARIGLDVLAALEVAHAAGVVHRDVKPANVLLDHGQAKLADFGIATSIDHIATTADGTVVGTAAYLAPEQARGEQVGPAADVYALGLVLLEAMTGRREYAGSQVESALARLQRPPAVPVGIPADFAALLRAMTRDEPADRPTAEQVAAALAAGPTITHSGAGEPRHRHQAHRESMAARFATALSGANATGRVATTH
jgi:eukaryotic-like serine/threonine-protein kinase